MERLKKVWQLFKLDWRRIYNNKLTLVLMMALMFIPSLYAWFNIEALWDPYSNTSGIKIGIYSDDETVYIKDTKINIGDDIVTSLKDNDSLGWQFVSSKKELDKKVKQGDFYAGVYLPKEFSSDLMSFTSGVIKQPEIEYQVNQKINAIAPKISDKGASTLQETIASEFITSVSESLLTVFNEIGFNLDNNLPSIKKLTSKIVDLDDNLDVLDEYANSVLKLQEKMPEYEKKLKLGNEFVEYLPELNQTTDKVVSLADKLPTIATYGELVYEVEGNLPYLKQAGEQLKKADEDVVRVTKMMSDAILEAEEGLGVIATAQEVMPSVTELILTADDMIPEVQQQLSEVADALPQITTGLTEGLEMVSSLSKTSAKLAAELAALNTNESSEQIHQQLVILSQQLETQDQLLGTLIDTLNELSTLPNAPDMSDAVNSLSSMRNQLKQVKSTVDDVLANWDMYAQYPEKLQQKLEEVSHSLEVIVLTVQPEEIEGKVRVLIEQTQAMLNESKKITGTLIDEGTLDTIDSLLKNTTVTINEAIVFLKEYQAEMPKIQEEIHAANLLLNNNMDLIISGVHAGGDFFRDDFPKIEKKSKVASDFIKKDLPDLESDIISTMDTVNEKVPKLVSALDTSSQMIKEDWPNVKDGIQKAASQIKKGEEDIDLEEVISYLKSDINKESAFLADPVALKETDIYPVPNYGSASTPFYTALCLWVGAVLFSSIATTKFHLSSEEEAYYTKRQQFLARMGTFLVVGFFQALIVTLGNQLVLGTYTAHPIWNVLFTLIIDLAFMMMVYVLVALFDNLGKGMAIIILVLSISAGGGNFPIEMSGPFFQAINPYIPFTYAVDLLRESVGGIYWPSALLSISVLVSVTIGFFVIGYILYPKSDKVFKRVSDILKEGHILH